MNYPRSASCAVLCGIVLFGLCRPAGAQTTAPDSGIKIEVMQTLQTPFVWRDPQAGAEIQPMVIVGARNGCFSGRVIVSSAGAIRGLKAEAGELVGPSGAKIAASAVAVRYSEEVTKSKSYVQRPSNGPTRASLGRFDGLLDAAPEVVPVRDVPVPAYMSEVSPRLRPGAVQPIWVTVRVSADTVAGDYQGKLTICAHGQPATEVPIQLKVHNWRIPDPKDFTVLHNLYQSHDSVALYYKTPLWSDRHFELMVKSLAMAHEVGSRFCVVHLIEDAFCMGNAQSMVRWVRKGDGSFSYDFTVFDRYLDVWAKANGCKPATLLLSVWARGDDGTRTIYGGKEIDLAKSELRSRHTVTLLDPATGKTESMQQPPFGTPESVVFWKPVLTEVRARLEKRGWFDVTALGTGDDAVPLPTTVEGFRQIWPDGRWMSTSHMNPRVYKAAEGKTMPVGFSEHVWSAGRLYNPDSPAMRKFYGGYPQPWSRRPDRIEWGHPRVGIAFIDFLYDSSPLVAWRFATEAAMQGNLDGIGRIGADFWPPPNWPTRGADSLAGTINLGPAYSTLAVLAPGPDGAIATERFEMLREGVQVAEAIVAVRKALAGKLSDDLADRCRTLLDERARLYMKAASLKKRAGDRLDWPVLEAAGWQAADERLFALAAELAGAAPAK